VNHRDGCLLARLRQRCISRRCRCGRPLPEDWSDQQIEQAEFPQRPAPAVWRKHPEPYALAHQEVGVHLMAETLEVLHRGVRVASHVRSYEVGKATTLTEHMPKAHQEYLGRTPSRLTEDARQTGPSIFSSKNEPGEQVCFLRQDGLGGGREATRRRASFCFEFEIAYSAEVGHRFR